MADRAQSHNQHPHGEEKPRRSEEIEGIDLFTHHKNGSGDDEESKVSDVVLCIPSSEGKEEDVKTAKVSDLDTRPAEKPPVFVDEAPAAEDEPFLPIRVADGMGCTQIRRQSWECGSCGDAPPFSVETAVPADGCCIAAPRIAFLRDEPYLVAPKEESLQQDVVPPRLSVFEEAPMEMKQAAPKVMPEVSRAEVINGALDGVKEHSLSQYCQNSNISDDRHDQTLEPDVAPMNVALAEDDGPALVAVRPEFGLRSPSPVAPSTASTSDLETAASELRTKESHTVALEILNGSKVLRAVVCIETCTRTAILTEARAYCIIHAQDDRYFERLRSNRWDLTLVSINMYGCDMDLSTYKLENLSSLIRTAEKTGIPRFTLRSLEI